MKRLTAERQAHGWSKAELARRAGIHPVTVGMIESGRLVPYQGQLLKLARALGIPEDEAADLMAKVEVTVKS